MELFMPGIGLIAWTVFSLLSLILMVTAIISLVRNNNLDSSTKLMWILIIILVPVIGAILYLKFGRQKNKAIDRQ